MPTSDEDTASSSTGRVPTNLRTLLILEAVAAADNPPSAAELGRMVGLPKPSAHRLCARLEAEGFLVHTEAGGGYRAGRRARLLASALLHSSSLHVARHQVMQALAAEIGETVNFVVPEDGGMSYKDRVETNWAFRIQLPVGTHVPFHCTASGKAWMATLPPARRRRVVRSLRLEAMTPNTITEPAALLEELERTAARGYALDDEEFMEGMVAAAVAVRDPQGRYAASLAFHGPLQRVTLERAIALTPALHRAAERLTEVMF
ncbi:MAG: IclR family transcriptional regulator [Alphaproteobacteria bacterium]|nr:MAG: IclR family transcriptional regulator [Alphaproteobacteria bacterium]